MEAQTDVLGGSGFWSWVLHMKSINWAAIVAALLSSLVSIHFKVSADGFEMELKRAQAQMDNFQLASCNLE